MWQFIHWEELLQRILYLVEFHFGSPGSLIFDYLRLTLFQVKSRSFKLMNFKGSLKVISLTIYNPREPAIIQDGPIRTMRILKYFRCFRRCEKTLLTKIVQHRGEYNTIAIFYIYIYIW